MEPSGMQSRMYPNMATPGMIGLEMPLHNRQPTPAAASTTTAQMVDFSSDHPHPQTQLSMRQSSYPPYAVKQPSSAASDDDEPNGSANDDGAGVGDNKRKASPWHRMKWTDTMVKLLIMAVYYIGDDAGAASSDGAPDTKKPKLSAAASTAGALQKKGKWKSVSRAMMEKGYCVSPQQCEDKFNDLNKRYKRVNDILGRGTACRVVENQSLLENMDVSPKLKEEVRKLLNSKHLFFREMCAYHNSCGHATAAATPESAPEQQNPHPGNHHHHHHHQPIQRSPIEDEEEDEDDDDFDDEEDDQAGNEVGGQLKGEMMRVMGDGGKSGREKRQWVAARAAEVEEEGLKYQREALEIEKQRMKWAVYSSKKEREMERMKLDNEKRRLENQRMLLLLRHKELELASDPSLF